MVTIPPLSSEYITTMPLDPTRDVAFSVLCGVLEQRCTLEEGLNLAIHKDVDVRDRAAAHRLAAACLRHFGTIVAILEKYLERSPPNRVILVLAMGVVQLLFLGTSPHAAVDTSINLLRRQRLHSFTGLANAILRKIARDKTIVLKEYDQPRLNIPAWLWASWGKEARNISLGLFNIAPLDIMLKPGALIPQDGIISPIGTVRFPPGTRPQNLPGYAEGLFWVQDAAAALPVLLLCPQSFEIIADLCAAPGGKTAQLMLSGASIVAVEQDMKRTERLRQNMGRLGFAPRIVVSDVMNWHPDQTFDAILLDAPCSGTGTVRRHPDVLYLKRAKDIRSLVVKQRNLLKQAFKLLKPGGRLIYSVCSLQSEEGEGQAAVAEKIGYDLLPFRKEEIPFFPEALTGSGWIKTHPGMWAAYGGLDGFFIARFRKPL